ncbi:ABC transporter ATP-binding protein [Microbacterium sp. CJ77]|uniref:ABC transporter ATP-binding protein n=1 Tax=Microbacterium sp. CJ77 TaxID=2079201 RepID=UPI0021560E57|nr:ABC transporter ATP-binding protein [Microbacterium sp. CJ77]
MSLVLSDVTVNRGIGPVVSGVSLELQPGQITTVVGPNGAGKTSLLEAISGLVRSYTGSIEVDGKDIHRMNRRQRSRAGIVHVQQGRAIFPSLTVRENIELASRDKERFAQILTYFPELEKRISAQTALLSGGEQQMVVLGRALATDPKYLLIDEMSLGLAPVVFMRLLPELEQVAATGVGILLVEQFAHLALGISSDALVISNGKVAYHGEPKVLLDDETKLHDAYMG